MSSSILVPDGLFHSVMNYPISYILIGTNTDHHFLFMTYCDNSFYLVSGG